MICYICNTKEASLQCPLCTRYACSTHTKPNPCNENRYLRVVNRYSSEGHDYVRFLGQERIENRPYFCSDCAGRVLDLLEKALHQLHQSYWCDFCGAINDSSNHAKCQKCNKRFCEKHGSAWQQPYSREYGYGTKYWGHEGYCNEHLPKCFIATSVYGNADATEVDVLRHFRDEVLLQSFIGKGIVSSYYLFSPYIVRLIDESHIFKSIIKITILSPMIWLINCMRHKGDGN